eukprot:2782833-Prymnesium_polylepis.3
MTRRSPAERQRPLARVRCVQGAAASCASLTLSSPMQYGLQRDASSRSRLRCIRLTFAVMM